MNSKLIKWLLTVMCGLLAACAIITVNVYFPEKAVKDAYKSLDDLLLKNNTEKPPATDKQPDSPPATTDSKPQGRLFDVVPSLSFAAVAQAAENVSDDLAVELAGMPEVVKAYDEMNRRMPRLNALFGSAAVGLTNQGLVTVRDKSRVSAQDEGLVAQENQSRKTVIGSMAKAILKINKVNETKPALDQVMGKAAATYAETKREAAQPGWWIQLPNNRWLQK
jgi:uncharacterized protein